MKILAELLAKITGVKRQQVRLGIDFQWSSKSWTHNVFRLYELIFWRRAGIRAELSSYPYEGGTLYLCHSWESVFALTETKIREFFKGLVPKFKIVSVPQFAVANNINTFGIPYLFAIAFDSQNSNDNGISLTNTYSITCTGSNLTLFTGAVAIQSPTPTETATYATFSMTDGVRDASTAFTRVTGFYLSSPSTGANNVVTTASASARNYGGSISLSGTDASPAGNSNTATGTSTTPSVSVTTGTANSWILNTVNLNNTLATLSPTATGTNQTSRYQVDHVAGGTSNVGSTQTTTTAGSYTSSWSLSTSVAWVSVALEIKPLVTNTTASGDMMRMSMGF